MNNPQPRSHTTPAIFQNQLRGIFFVLCSAVGFASMGAFVRLAGDVPALQKSFFRNFIAFFIAFIVLKKEHVRFEIHKGDLKWLLLRSTFGTVGIIANFYAVDHLVLSDANMLNKMSPFFSILFSFLFLKEKVKPFQILAVIGAFIGALFIIKPTFAGTDHLAYLIAIIGGAGAGFAYTMVRKLGLRGVKGPVIVLFFSAFSCLVVVPWVVTHYQPMEWWQLGSLLMAGVCASLGQFSITAAYRTAPAREISVYEYSQIIISAILGYVMFSQVPDVYSILGYLIICSMGVLMFLYNSREKEPSP